MLIPDAGKTITIVGNSPEIADRGVAGGVENLPGTCGLSP